MVFLCLCFALQPSSSLLPDLNHAGVSCYFTATALMEQEKKGLRLYPAPFTEVVQLST